MLTLAEHCMALDEMGLGRYIQPTEDNVLAVGFFVICRYSISRRSGWRDH